MKNKKIKVLIDVFYYRTAGAGIRSYIFELVKGLKKYVYKNIQYVFSHNIQNYISKSIYLNPSNKLIRWVFQLHYFIWKQIILPLKTSCNSIDYLICPDFVLPMYVHKVKKICVIHDTLFWDYPKSYSFFWRHLYIKMITGGIDNKTTIITTTNFSKKNIKRILNRKNRIKVIYQTSSIIESSKLNSKIVKNEDKFILHVGSFEERKDLLTLVKAFKKLKCDNNHQALKLVMVGNDKFHGNKKIRNKIIQFLNKNNLSKDVIIPGYLKKEEISFLYSEAILYVFPSLEEGFGIPILEAFHLECPLLCSDAAALKEIAFYSAVFFKKGNSNDLYLKMKQLILDEAQRKTLVKKGKERLKLFSLKSFIKSYEREILNQ